MIRTNPLRALVLAPLAALLTTAPAAAESEWPAKRVAVLVGANMAAPGRQPLLFGHDDASKMASVLTTVAGFRKQDVFVLKDPSAEDLLKAVHTAATRLENQPESLLYFYYSGHADDQALYPAGQAVPLSKLREVIDGARIAVRIGMVDACHGGGWTRTKGLRPDRPFHVRWPLSLDNEGSVLIASSSGLESAHESDTLRGSFFTHHFASGLRGAADRNGNSEVTITEAFEYAKERTIRDTLKIAREPQHPSFAVNLRGRRDLVIAQISQSSSTLQLSQQHGPLELVHIESGVALLELPAGPRQVKLAVPPGNYLVRKKYPGSIASREVTVRAGGSTTIDEDQLTLMGNQHLVAKSFVPTPAPPPPDEKPGGAPGWVKAAAITSIVVAAASLALSFKFAQDINGVNRELDPYRRYACRNGQGNVCSRDQMTRLADLKADEHRFVAELQSEGKRFEAAQYVTLTISAVAAVASVPLLMKWIGSSTGPPDEGKPTTLRAAFRLSPTWLRGPGLALNTPF